jgi:hypothetical protein
MELGASSLLSSGGIVGVSWTSTSAALEADLLITTTASQVQIHAADDKRLISSWLTRPGATNRFTVPTVQHRLWRTLFAVQDGCKLFAWHEREPSLERAARARLRGEVFALRVSKHIPALVVVYVDGSVGVHNERLEEVFMMPAAGDGGRATWARLTSLPGAAAGRCVLMVLTQGGGGEGGGGGGGGGGRRRPVAPPPAGGAKLLVFALGVSAAPAGAAPAPPPPSPGAPPPAAPGAPPAPAYALSLRHVATQALAPPAGTPPGATVAAVTLHKFLAQLGVVWSSGQWAMLQFPRGASWYASAPREALSRHLRGVVPGCETAPAGGELRCAAFALDPSCCVLVGSNGRGGVGMSVWDVRYGVLLGSAGDVGGGEAGEGGADADAAGRSGGGGAAAGAGAKRKRGGPPAAAAAAATAASVSEQPASASAAPPPPPPLLHVTVSEGGSWVVVATFSRVSITPVAVRGASLSAALGRMLPTAPLLVGGGGGGGSGDGGGAALFFSLDACVAAAAAAGMGTTGASLPPSAAAAWAAARDPPAAALTYDAAAIENAATHPTAASLRPLLACHGVVWAPAGNGEGPALGAVRRGGAAAPSPPPSTPPPLPLPPLAAPPPIAAALLRRCAAELRAASAPAPAPAAAAAHVSFLAPLAAALSRWGAGALHCGPVGAPLLSALLQVASLRVPHPAAVAAPAALCAAGALLRAARDLPEGGLVDAFAALLGAVPARTLAAGWQLAGPAPAPARGRGGGSGGPRGAASTNDNALSGLLYFAGLIFSAPRNDVFMEGALRALTLPQVEVLLALLLRLLRVHGEHTLPAARDSGAPASPVLPSLATTLDWLRLVLDAHFAALLLQCRAQAARAGGAPAPPPGGLLGLLDEAAAALQAAEHFAGEAADVKGQLEHILNRLPLPQPPEPEYCVELLRFE